MHFSKEDFKIKHSANPPVAFPNAYWIIPGLLMAGEFPGGIGPVEAQQRLESLYKAGIRKVINLMEPDETDHQGQLFRPYDKILPAEFRGQYIYLFLSWYSSGLLRF
jgi:hypothetical protein